MHCAPFTDYASEINNTQIDNAKYIDVVINMHNLIEYSEDCSQISGRLWQYYRDQPNLNDDGNIIDFPVNDNTSLSIKQKNTTGRAENDGMKKVKISLKYLNSF